jgi:hypothetical protein
VSEQSDGPGYPDPEAVAVADQIASEKGITKESGLMPKIVAAAVTAMAIGMTAFQVYNYLRKAPLVQQPPLALGLPTFVPDHDDHSGMFKNIFGFGKKTKKSVKKTKKSVRKSKKSVKKSKKSVKRK